MTRPVKTWHSIATKEFTLSKEVCLSWPDTLSEGKRRLGDIMAFGGYTIDRSSRQTSDISHVTLWWLAPDMMDTDCTAFIHIVGPDGLIWAQQDRLLQKDGRPNSAWQAAEVVQEVYELELPAHATESEYTVKTGIYYWETGERLPAWDEDGQRLAEDAIVLDRITVTR